jgi:two-component system, LuxR family, sensor kinase FixL
MPTQREDSSCDRPEPEEREPAAEAAAAGAAVRDHSAALHGRLLQVSRLATIGEMAAGVAHELNQPLTAISNYAHACKRLLERPRTDVAEVREALQQISEQTTRAADIIRRLRALAQNRQSAHTFFNINDLVAELHELLRTDAILHNVELSLDLATGLPAVSVDAGQVQHVILNFVRNSLEALAVSPASAPHIVIRTSATAHEVELAVSDNGPGVAPEALHRVFDPFFSTKEQGTGLGLAISSSIARAHGGSVGCRPNPGGGACFFILLPIQRPE